MLAHPNRMYDPGRGGGLAIGVTIIVAYISAFLAVGMAFGPVTWLILIGLGVVHFLLSLPFSGFFFRDDNAFRVGAYFFIQAVLCGLILFVGQAQFWLLLMPLASEAASILSRKMTVLYFAIIMMVFALPLGWDNKGFDAQYVLIFLCALVFVWVFTEVAVRDRELRRDGEKLTGDLQAANRRLQEYAVQAEELARSQERIRMARDIHDSLGHYLTVVSVQLEAAKALMESRGWKEQGPDLYSTLEKALALTRNGLDDVRRSVSALREGRMGEKPFLEALNQLVEDSRSAGILIYMDVHGSPRRLEPRIEMTLYRTVQEALTNIRKHSRASRADIDLEFGERDIYLLIQDNGVGFSAPGEAEGQFGLLGIRERVELLQGQMEVSANTPGGVRLSIRLPV